MIFCLHTLPTYCVCSPLVTLSLCSFPGLHTGQSLLTGFDARYLPTSLTHSAGSCLLDSSLRRWTRGRGRSHSSFASIRSFLESFVTPLPLHIFLLAIHDNKLDALCPYFDAMLWHA